MSKFEVGKIAPQPFWPCPPQVTGDQGILEQAEDGSFYISMYWANITAQDVELWSAQKRLEARTYESQGHILLIVCPKGTSVWSELPFDSGLYQDSSLQRATTYINESLWQLSLIERTNGKVKGVRVLTPPQKLLDICRESWLNPKPGYNDFLRKSFSLPQKELWKRAEQCGFFGDA